MLGRDSIDVVRLGQKGLGRLLWVLCIQYLQARARKRLISVGKMRNEGAGFDDDHAVRLMDVCRWASVGRTYYCRDTYRTNSITVHASLFT